MKKVLFAIFAGLVLLLTGCAAPVAGSDIPVVQTSAQIAANLTAQVKKACLVVQPTIAGLQAQTSLLTADQVAKLTSAASLADEICTAAVMATVQTSSVANFLTTATPVMTELVQLVPLDPAQKVAAAAALALIKTALAQAGSQ